VRVGIFFGGKLNFVFFEFIWLPIEDDVIVGLNSLTISLTTTVLYFIDESGLIGTADESMKFT